MIQRKSSNPTVRSTIPTGGPVIVFALRRCSIWQWKTSARGSSPRRELPTPKMSIQAIRGLSMTFRLASFATGYRVLLRSLKDIRIALKIVRDLAAGFSNDDLGRALAEHANTGQWQADRTFESQGARYRELLIESGLIDRNGELTGQGGTFLGQQASVWWVNQGATYTKERDGGFLWAPMLNKAGRPQYHWDTMDEVREGDVVLHYSNGSLRAASHVSAAARPAPNPLGDQAWEEAGRLVETQYQELNEPVALGAIDEGARISQGSPFTVTGSVQQVYLVRLQEDFVNELAQRFPELAPHLPSVPAAARSTPTSPEAPMPAELFRDFADAVEASGLRFSAGSNLVRSLREQSACQTLRDPDGTRRFGQDSARDETR